MFNHFLILATMSYLPKKIISLVNDDGEDVVSRIIFKLNHLKLR